MNNQYYPNYIGGPVTTGARSAQPAAYADSIPPHGAFGDPGYPYEDPALQHGTSNYQISDGLGRHSMVDQKDNVTMGSPYEYFSGSLPDEDFEMPESQRTIAKERRKAQNRTAQKAFRHRKETRIKELEQHLETVEKEKQSLEKAYEDLTVEKKQLQAEIEQLSAENAYLRGGGGSSVSTAAYDANRWPSAAPYDARDPQHLYGPPGY